MFRRLASRSSVSVSALLFAAAGSLSGCLSGQIGGEVDNNGDEWAGEGERCDEEETDLAATEATSLGFTVEDLVEVIEGTHDAPLVWSDLDVEGVTITPGTASTTEIEIEVTALLDTARYVAREAKSNDSGSEGFPAIGEVDVVCSDAIRIDAEVRVVTGNGALEDTFTTTFSSTDGLIASTRIPLSPGELEGSFDVDVSQLENAEANGTALNLQIAFGQISGTVVSAVQQVHGEATSHRSLAVAEFPGGEDGCTVGVPIGDSPLVVAIEQALGEHTEFEFSWQGEETLGLTIDPGLIGPFCYENNSQQGMAKLRANGQFAVELADGSIDGSWPLEIQAEVLGGEVIEVHVLRNSYLAVRFAAADFEEATGISGIESDAAELTYSFGYIVHVQDDLPAAGEITLMEALVPECAQPGNEPPIEEYEGGGTVPGCAGIDFVEFQNGSFSD